MAAPVSRNGGNRASGPVNVMKPSLLPRSTGPSPVADGGIASASRAVERRKANILLVDDRPDKLLALEAVLSGLGENIVRANSGKEALRQLLKQEFAVILLEVSILVELHRKSELVKIQAAELQRLEERKHQQELAVVEDRLEVETRRNRFFTLSLDLLAIASFDDFFIQLNPAWESTLGFSADELRAHSLLEFVHPEDRTITAEQLTRVKMGTAPSYFENRYR